MELISRAEVLKILSNRMTGVVSGQIYTNIAEEIIELPCVEPEQIKANVKRLYRYEKAAAKRRDGKG